MTITQTITQLPSPPDPASDRPSTFSTKAAAYAIAQKQMGDELNVWSGQFNQSVSEVLSVDWPNVAAAAQGYRDQSASSAAQALVARDAAITASQVATASTENLAAIVQSLHTGNVVAAFVYDTSKDSDGGAWRKRCKHTSWENEALVPGKWLGRLTDNWFNEVAAIGGQVGDYFQSTVYPYFYRIDALGAAPVATIVNRGNKREFPAVAGIVVESGRVVIYDLTAPGCPMWMVFTAPSGTQGVIGWASTGTPVLSCGAMVNGVLYIGGNGQIGAIAVNFAADVTRLITVGAYTLTSGRTVADRNATTAYVSGGDGYSIVNGTVNSIAATVLPTAPVDPATGLQMPTIVVGTQGGVSVIKDDGTVVNSSLTSAVRAVAFNGYDLLYSSLPGVAYGTRIVDVRGVTAGFLHSRYIDSAAPSIGKAASFIGAGKLLAGRQDPAVDTWAGISLVKENPANRLQSMVAFITNTYNTGWMVGDIRGAWLADTVAENITGTELVTNGTFDTNTAGWTAANGATLSVDTGRLKVTNSASATANGYASQAIATVAGKTYRLSVDYDRGAATATMFAYVGTAQGASNLGSASSGTAGNPASGKFAVEFTATGTTTYLSLIIDSANSSFGFFDNVSCRLTVPDRSVKGKGVQVNGTLTKSPVAAGAQLMGYGGFSPANYAKQPYNSDLDSGTGDFHAGGWYSKPSTTAGALVSRGVYQSASALFMIYVSANVEVYAGGVSSALTVAAPPVGAWNRVDVVRTGGVLYLYLNSVLAGQVANTASMTNTLAELYLGLNVYGMSAEHNGSLALWKFSATAPSADQIAQMYRDELALFQPGAQCTLDGNSTAVTALAYDDLTDLLHVGTSWGRSTFKGLQRVESAATSVGTVASIGAGFGAHVTAGATGARYTQPAIGLRDELRNKYEAKQAAAKEIVTLDADFIAGQTTYTLPYGFTTKNVWANAAPKRRGTGKDYTVSFDGYRETITFASAPGAVWVRIDMNRSA